MKKLFGLLLAFVLVCTLTFASAEKLPKNGLSNPLFEAWFISVGVGDAILLKSGDETMLIDGGHKAKRAWMEKFLKEYDISVVDIALNTHWHDDHTTGLLYLLKNGFVVGTFYTQYPETTKLESYKELVPLLKSGNDKYVVIGGGYEFDFGNAHIKVLQDPDVKHDPNARSLVLKVTIGERTMLLAGDVGPTAQKILLKEYGAKELAAEVLKFPHHGINICVKPFMDAVCPQIAIVTNQVGSVPKTESQLTSRKIKHYYTCFRTVYVATDGNMWYSEQEEAKK
jgi:competence protein ComEC